MTHSGDQVEITNRHAWRAWLEKNHAQPVGIWLVTYKKHIPDKHVPYEAVVEEALCFGWIDSLPRKLDENRSMLWLAPRKPSSNWSAKNKQRAEKMIAAGRMATAGLEKITQAKQDGTWMALNNVENLEIPPDLEKSLQAFPSAEMNFEAFPRSVKRGILEWIESAKTPATREKRISETALQADKNIRANQWRQTKQE